LIAIASRFIASSRLPSLRSSRWPPASFQLPESDYAPVSQTRVIGTGLSCFKEKNQRFEPAFVAHAARRTQQQMQISGRRSRRPSEGKNLWCRGPDSNRQAVKRRIFFTPRLSTPCIPGGMPVRALDYAFTIAACFAAHTA
jgi:hypothetical protein